MADQIKVVNAILPAGTAGVSVTSVGFGVPNAAMVHFSGGDDDANLWDGQGLGIGFAVNGGSQYCNSTRSLNSVATTNSSYCAGNNFIVLLGTSSGDLENIVGQFAATFTTDGIDIVLASGTNPRGMRISVTLFSSAIQASLTLDSWNLPGGAQSVNAGFEPDVVFSTAPLVYDPTTAPFTGAGAYICAGVGANTSGGIVQRAMGWGDADGVSGASLCQVEYHDGLIAAPGYTNNNTYGHVVITAFTPTGYDVLTDGGNAGTAFVSLAALNIKLNNGSANIVDSTFPGSDTNHVIATGVNLDCGMVFSTSVNLARNTNAMRSDGVNVISFDGTATMSSVIMGEGTTTFDRLCSVSGTEAELLSTDYTKWWNAPAVINAQNVSFNITGATGSRNTFVLAIDSGDPAPAGVTFVGPNIVNQTGDENQVFTFDENGEGTVASRFTVS